MNKKVLTLCVSALLATSVGAFAADVTPNFVKAAQPETAGNYKEGMYYQLASEDGAKVLVMDKTTDGKFYLQLVPFADATLANSLWLIEPTTTSDAEGGLSYRFKNKLFGLYISYNPNDAYKATGNVSFLPGQTDIWKWSESTVESKFVNGATVSAAFGAERDSVVYLAENSDGTIAAVKEAAKNNYAGKGVVLTPKTAGRVFLGVDDLNSMLGMQDFATGKLQLSFNPETTGENLFTKNEYRAVPAAGENSYSQAHLAQAQAWEKYWTNEVNEYKAAFDKVGTMDEYLKAQERLNNLAAALMPYEEYEKLVQTVTSLQTDLTKKKEAVKSAIESYDGSDRDVRIALEALNEALNAFDDAEKAKYDNMDNLAHYEAAKAAILDGKTTLVKDALEGLTTNWNEQYSVWAEKYGNYTSAKDEVEKSWAELKEAAGGIKDIDFSTLESYIAQYDANIQYLNNINTSITKVDESLIPNSDGFLIEGNSIESVEGMSVNSIQVTLQEKAAHGGTITRGQYGIELKEYKSWTTLFAATQQSLKKNIDLEIEKIVTELAQNNENAFNASADYVTKWNNVKIACEGISDAYFQFMIDIAESIGALNDALTMGDEDLAAIEAKIEEYTKNVDVLDEAYEEAKTDRDNAFGTLYDNYGTTRDDVKSIIDAYNAQINTYDKLISANAELAAENQDLAAWAAAFADFQYFDNINWMYGIAVDMESWWSAIRKNCELEANQWVSLAYGDPKDGKYSNYLMVDTAYMTKDAGTQYQSFAVKEFKKIDGNSVAANDINGRINYRFMYYPSQDSLMIWSEGGALKFQTTEYWTEMSPEEVRLGQFGNLVKVQVLGDKREVTVERVELVSKPNPAWTINTRIGFAYAETATPSQLAEGIYLIQKKDNQGMYYVDNFLGGKMGLTAPKAQELKHIPAAQWVVKALANSTYNTIVNRESEDVLGEDNSTKGTYFQNVQLYSLGANTYKTETGDTIYVTNITDEVKGKETLGYVALPDDKNPDADYRSYALDYLNGVAEGLARISVVEEDGQLTVAATDAPMYFTFETEKGDTTAYGATVSGEKQLKKVAYRIKAENNYNHAGEADRYITLATDGSYVLGDKEDAAKFWLKEFKHNASGVCYYVLINTKGSKVSVQDYPTVLLDETLETATIDEAQERTSAFALTEKAEPKYRRLGATVEGDGFEADAPANATFHHVGYENVTLYENTLNKGAGTSANPSKPTGVNFLGQFNSNDLSANAAIYVDTAYVRNDTKRPQYLLALRPDFTPLLEPCPEDPTHPAHEIAQTKADYLVVLNDSINNKDAKEKMYQFQGYTRLAFVPATHRRDTLIIENSKFTGTKDAAKDSIYLGKNEYNNATFQFLLAEESETYGDFYIEVAKNAWLKIHNEIPVIVNDITKADIFNINTTTDAPTANESIVAGEVSVVATDGAVIVKGAEGKNVIVSTILGKVVANEVLNSDNETIAAPAGIVVVSVDGESFKVAVK